jgi:multidrug efflux system membrane fusion protein
VVGDDGSAARRNVELGAQRGELRIITAGLEEGERVIVKGLQRVKPGQKVEAEVTQVSLPPSSLPKSAAANPSDETPSSPEPAGDRPAPSTTQEP